MTRRFLVSELLLPLLFLAGLASIIYGVSLWSHPVAFIIAGIFTAAIAFLLGYNDLRSRR